MSAWVKNYGGLFLSAIVAASALAVFVSRSVASERVAPVETQVSVLRSEVEAQKVQNLRIEDKLDRLIDMHLRSPQ